MDVHKETLCDWLSCPGETHWRAAQHERHREILQAFRGRTDTGALGAPPAGGSM